MKARAKAKLSVESVVQIINLDEDSQIMKHLEDMGFDVNGHMCVDDRLKFY